jgi:outer membrane receptor protein involved in Fe transport
VQHRIGNTGFGVGANYTLVLSGLKYDNASLGEQFALEGLSNAANVVAYYENDKFNVRAAYNWRGEFLTARFDGSGGANPVYTEPYGQLDLTFGYKFNSKLSLQAEVLNVNDGIQRLHERTKEQVVGVTQTGRRYMVGARYTF